MLYQGKTHRWVVRYTGDRQKPFVNFIVPLTDQHKSLIERAGLEIGANNRVVLNRPENLMKLSAIIFDALAFCQDDSNFKRKGQEAEGQVAAV